MKCFNCDKGIIVGKQHKHHKGVAGKRWLKRAPTTQKIFKPNLHSARILINGLPRLASGKAGGYKRVKLCTKCLRILKKRKDEKEAKNIKPQETIVATA